MPEDFDCMTLLRSLPLAISVVDSDLRFVEITDIYLQLTSTIRASVIGRTVAEVFPPQDKAQRVDLEATYRRVFDTGEVIELPPYGYSIVGADGVLRERYWRLTRWPIRQHGVITHVATLGEDVTKIELLRQLIGTDKADVDTNLSALATTVESLRRALRESA